VTFIDGNGDPLPVDAWVFTARALVGPGNVTNAQSLTVDTSQASAGQVTVVAPVAVIAALDDDGDAVVPRVWSLTWTVAGTPSGRIGGAFTIYPEGSRGFAGVTVTS